MDGFVGIIMVLAFFVVGVAIGWAKAFAYVIDRPAEQRRIWHYAALLLPPLALACWIMVEG